MSKPLQYWGVVRVPGGLLEEVMLELSHGTVGALASSSLEAEGWVQSGLAGV